MSGSTQYLQDRELAMLARAADDFAGKELAPFREEYDRYPFGPFFDSVLEKAFDLDFFHIMLPEELNGTGQGLKALSVVLENISRQDAGLAGIIFTNEAALRILTEAGEKGQLEKIAESEKINDFLTGLSVYTNPAETLPELEARPEGRGYRLTGKADYVSLGGLAPRSLVLAKIPGEQGCSFFLADTSDEGVHVSEPVLSLGMHACPAADITFERAGAALIGRPGRAEHYFRETSDVLHAAAAAMAAGVMKGSFNEAFNYSKNRFQGGQQIIRWSEMKMMLANMAIRVKNAEMTLASALQAAESNHRDWKRCCAAAALEIQAAACDVTSDGIQAMGGAGYMKDFGQEKRFRDARQIQSLLGMAGMKRVRYIESMLG